MNLKISEDLTTWKIVNMIKNGQVEFNKGDVVVLFRRKNDGHPRGLKDGKDYIIKRIEVDNLELIESGSTSGLTIKVHRNYLLPKNFIRDLKINSILRQTNL